jgi:hypothetical protein
MQDACDSSDERADHSAIHEYGFDRLVVASPGVGLYKRGLCQPSLGKRWLASFTYLVQAGQFALERFIEQFVPVVARDPQTISLAVSVSPSVLPARRAPLAAAKTVAASVFSSSVTGIALTGQGG